MGVADDLFFQPVAAFGIGAGHLIAKRLLQMLDFTFQAAFLFVEKSLAVGDEKLRVANLRTVEGRIVDLGHNALGQGEPYADGGRLSGLPINRSFVSRGWVLCFRAHDQVTNYPTGACESPAGVLKTG